MRFLMAWSIALAMYALKLTCRYRTHNDRRDEILRAGKTYIYGQLHAHQICAGMFGERGTAAMVSRSADAAMVVPMLQILGKQIVRGSSSSGSRTKGGASALQKLIRLVQQGHRAVIAVDGPRGPRGSVHKGIGLLAKKSGMPIVPVVAVPARRWILSKTWDRMQIPQPFTRIDFYFGDPIEVTDDTDLEAVAIELGNVLHDLEAMHDAAERGPRFVTAGNFQKQGRAA